MALKVNSTKLHASSLPNDWEIDVVEDWLNKTNDIVDTADAVNNQESSIDALTEENASQQVAIESNTELATSAQSAANSALSQAGDNASAIAQNASDISDNASAIGTNAIDVSGNATAITNLSLDLTDHENSTIAHDSTGDIVGNQDYCTTSIGGVVNIAALVSDALPVVISIADAPATYNQAHIQALVDSIRLLGDEHNALVTLINSLLAGQKAAKQMSNV